MWDLVSVIRAHGELMSDDDVKIRDGSVIEIVRTGSLLYRCLLSAPGIYPAALADAYRQYLGPELLRTFLETGGHLVIAERDHQLAGFTCGVPDSARPRFGTYYGAWIAVDPDVRLKGIGSRLLQAIEGRAFDAGCHKFYELVQMTNEPAVRFFERAGHVTEGVLRRHWNGDDFYLMSHFAEQWRAGQF